MAVRPPSGWSDAGGAGAPHYAPKAVRPAGPVVSDPNAPGWSYEVRSDGSYRVVAAPAQYRSSVGHVLRAGSPGFDELQARLQATSLGVDPVRYTDATVKAFKSGGMEGWSRVGVTALQYAPQAISALSHVKLHKNATKQLAHLKAKLAKTRNPRKRAKLASMVQSLQAQINQSQAAGAEAGIDPVALPTEVEPSAGLPSWAPLAAGGVAILLIVMLVGK